jgi:hypothetical protein
MISSFEFGRIRREQKTLILMIELYCRGMKHTKEYPCPECLDLKNFALERLGLCRCAGKKPACSHCPSPCYPPAKREVIRKVMRFAGPRMLMRHPLLALLHLSDIFSSNSPNISHPRT